MSPMMCFIFIISMNYSRKPSGFYCKATGYGTDAGEGKEKRREEKRRVLSS